MDITIFRLFEENADSGKAAEMSAYMRDQFQFLGIPNPLRRELSKAFLKSAKKEAQADWDFIGQCWEKPQREFQYLAADYLLVVKNTLTPVDVPRLKQLAVTKSWWDTVDVLDRIVGSIALRFATVNETLLEWSVSDNIWLRRIAIDHQLPRKGQTDTALLRQVIVNNLGQKEFFINKAIGWSLREYSKTDPDWVGGFIEEFRDQLAPLSIREGSKYVKQK